jgi:hypothetical protein
MPLIDNLLVLFSLCFLLATPIYCCYSLEQCLLSELQQISRETREITRNYLAPSINSRMAGLQIGNEENASSMTVTFTCVYSVSCFFNKAACYCTLVVFWTAFITNSVPCSVSTFLLIDPLYSTSRMHRPRLRLYTKRGTREPS